MKKVFLVFINAYSFIFIYIVDEYIQHIKESQDNTACILPRFLPFFL